MSDQNEIIRRLAEQAGSPDAVARLRAALNTPDRKKSSTGDLLAARRNT